MNLKKKLERYLRVNLLGPGPRLMKKRIYRAAISQRLRNTDITQRHLCYCIPYRVAHKSLDTWGNMLIEQTRYLHLLTVWNIRCVLLLHRHYVFPARLHVLSHKASYCRQWHWKRHQWKAQALQTFLVVWLTLYLSQPSRSRNPFGPHYVTEETYQ